MVRFTKKIKDNLYVADYDKEICLNKLGQLEDMEQELGIECGGLERSLRL